MNLTQAVSVDISGKFVLLRTCIKHGSVNKPKIRTLWHPPDDGWTKINVDGAFSSGEGASGAIARDHRGLFLAAKAIWYPNAANALTMEAHAIRDGVVLARDQKFQKVIIETDSLVLSKVLNSGNFKRSEIASILFDIVELSKGFCGFSVVFIRRAGNVAAHMCAQYSVKERQRCIWTEYAPDFICNCLSVDCNPVAME
ncbi:hypothetical protein QYE76_004372 [Lolium multiflorum]|uniref:RNase H type-1 domain-containing protein n=1 Tax=Lolium multiflorum TaxID=4521 RepID=A0AAD8RT32_LOLMU|nr:hypothetical protein QYE76_004372 [Lolium multiflorum]